MNERSCDRVMRAAIAQRAHTGTPFIAASQATHDNYLRAYTQQFAGLVSLHMDALWD